MRQLYLVSHAESIHQVKELTGGWYNTGLTATGRQQAARIAEDLFSKRAGSNVAIYTSDLLRAVETAQAIACQFEVEPTLLPDLRELCHGDADGKPKNWLQVHRLPETKTGEDLNFRICTGAESVRECVSRIYAAIAKLDASEQTGLIVISHSFVANYIIQAWLGVAMDCLNHCQLVIEPASISLLEEDELGCRVLVYLNSTSHL